MRGHDEATVNDGVQDDRKMILPGKTFWMEGSILEVFGDSLEGAVMMGNWAARHYKTRANLFGLPTNSSELYYGKIDGLGHVLHSSEFTRTK